METDSVFITHSVVDKSSSLQASRLDGLEEVHHTLCLQPLHLGVDGDERSCALHAITAI